MSSAPPRVDYYFDELTLGQRFESGGYRFTEAAIVDFAFQFDPQPFHIDVDAAKESHFGGLIASGFHTLNIAFRMLYQTGFMRGASLGGPGMDELRWLKPVRPGDTIRAVAEVIELRPSKSKPDRGVAKFRLAALNQANEEVMTAIMMVIMKRGRE